MYNLENIIIFGAGNTGEEFLQSIFKHRDHYNVLAFADNDINKIGKEINGIKIIDPAGIRQYQYDVIIIGSNDKTNKESIYNQLTLKYKISKNKVSYTPKGLYKKVFRPFMDKKTYNFASDILKTLINYLNNNNLIYYLEFGTLLGIVRDNKILEWDDDIDISIQSSDFIEVNNRLDFLFMKLKKDFDEIGIQHEKRIRYSSPDKPIQIDLNFSSISGEINEFDINISLLYFVDGYGIQVLNKMPERMYLTNENIDWEGIKVRVPKNYDEYLEITYGDWKVPKKSTSYDDYVVYFEDYNKNS